jgi:hypothetical protein
MTGEIVSTEPSIITGTPPNAAPGGPLTNKVQIFLSNPNVPARHPIPAVVGEATYTVNIVQSSPLEVQVKADPGDGVRPGFSVKQDAVVTGVPAHQKLFYKWIIQKCWTCEKINTDMTGEIVSTEPSVTTGTPPTAVPGPLTNKVQIFLSNPNVPARHPIPAVVGETTYTVNIIKSKPPEVQVNVDPSDGVRPGFSVKLDAAVTGVPAHQKLFYKWIVDKSWAGANMNGEIFSTEPSILTGISSTATPGPLVNKVLVFLSNPNVGSIKGAAMPPVVGETKFTVNVIQPTPLEVQVNVDPSDGVRPGFSVKLDAAVTGVPAHQKLFYKWIVDKSWAGANMNGEIFSTEPSILTGISSTAVPGPLVDKVQVFLRDPHPPGRSASSAMPPIVGETKFTVNVIGSSLPTSINSNEDISIATKDNANSNDTFLDTLSRNKPVNNPQILADDGGRGKDLTMSLTEPKSSSSSGGAKFRSEVTIKDNTQNNNCLDADQNGLDDITSTVCGAQYDLEAPTMGTCGLSIVSGVPVNYGELTPGQDSAERAVTFQNDGNSKTPAKVMIRGGDWVADELVGGQNQVISGPEVTRFSSSVGNYNGKSPVSKDAKEFSQISGGESSQVFLQFKAWDNPPIGSFHQDVTIDVLC